MAAARRARQAFPERLHQGSRSASRAREMRRRARAISNCASVATAARLGRVARGLDGLLPSYEREKTAERRGWTHGTRRAFTVDRLGESDAPAMPKLERRRSARALPAVLSLAMHGMWTDARLARCVGLRRSSAQPTHTFSARVELPRTFDAGSLSNERLRAPRAKGGWWGVTRGLPKMELPRPSLWLT